MAKVYDVFSSDAFTALNDQHQKQLTRGLDFFQSATGKSDVVRSGVAGVDIFQSATGKSLPRVLCLTSFTNLVLIANYCQSPQELLFYIVYAHRERLKAKELPHAFESDAYRSLLGGEKKNYSKKLKEYYPAASFFARARTRS